MADRLSILRCRPATLVAAVVAATAATLVPSLDLRFGDGAIVTGQSPLAAARSAAGVSGGGTFTHYLFEADAEKVAPLLAPFAAAAGQSPPREHGPALVLNDLDGADLLQTAQRSGAGHFLDATTWSWNGRPMTYVGTFDRSRAEGYSIVKHAVVRGLWLDVRTRAAPGGRTVDVDVEAAVTQVRRIATLPHPDGPPRSDTVLQRADVSVGHADVSFSSPSAGSITVVALPETPRRAVSKSTATRPGRRQLFLVLRAARFDARAPSVPTPQAPPARRLTTRAKP